ncbi:MAG: general secretion pathway protein GspB [Steroidobacteraceae bacterium]
MSFILDALKKSEMARQRQAVPGLMDSGVARPRARFPLWAVALVLLLAVNLVVLLFVLTRGGTPAAVSPAAGSSAAWSPAGRSPALSPAIPTPSPAAAAPAAAATPEHFSPLDGAPVYAPEIPAAAEAAAGEPAVHHKSADSGAVRARAAHRSDPLPTDEGDKADQEVLPSISEINLTGQQALPDLHLDVHVFATKPADRFVYINMRKYREGATLEEGPTLERIRRDGVILNFHGLRFVLPRQQ